MKQEGRYWRTGIALVIGMLLGLFLSWLTHGWSFPATLLTGMLLVGLYVFLLLPWVMLGHGWIWAVRESRRRDQS